LRSRVEESNLASQRRRCYRPPCVPAPSGWWTPAASNCDLRGFNPALQPGAVPPELEVPGTDGRSRTHSGRGWSPARHHASSAWGDRRGSNPRARGHGPVLCPLSYDHHGPQRRTRTSDTGRIRSVLLTLELPAGGPHGWTRTSDTQPRKPALCPAELRADGPHGTTRTCTRPSFVGWRSVH
jgi:hypothetical protein